MLISKTRNQLTLQRHFNALPKFARVESRAFGHERPRNVAFYTSVNLCVRKHVRISVAVGLKGKTYTHYLLVESVHTPTVSLALISLVASSCGYYTGQIEHRAAQ